jgi:integrase
MKPGAVRREVPDGDVRGLYLQIFPSGKQSWCFRFRFARKPRKLTLGPSPEIGLKEARDLARKAHGEIASGEDPAARKQAAKIAARTPVDRDLVEKVAVQFLQRHVEGLSPTTSREVTRLLNKEVVAPWRGRRLSQISRADIHELLDRIVDRPAPIQANRTLAWVRAMCNWATGRGLIDVSPCLGVKAPAPSKSRDRVLSDQELTAVWLASGWLDAPYAALVKLLIVTGQRRTEVAAMKWSEIDLDNKLWVLPTTRTKNGVEHSIPLSAMAVEILRSIRGIEGSDFVLTSSGRRSISGFYEAKGQIDRLMPPGTPPWVLHDVRRSVASGMAKLGINLAVVEKLLNHVSGSFAGIVGVYQRYSFADEKRAAMETWARHVEQLVRGEHGNVVSINRAVADHGLLPENESPAHDRQFENK